MRTNCMPAIKITRPLAAFAATAVMAVALFAPRPLHGQAAAAAAPRPQSLPPVKAKLLLREGKDTLINRDVTLLGRTTSAVLAQGTAAGAPPPALIEKAQIIRCTFAPDFDRTAMVRALQVNDWAGAVRALSPGLRPLLPYLDLPDNDAFDLTMDLGDYMSSSARAELRAATDAAARERALKQYEAAYDIFRNAWRADWNPYAQIAILKGCLAQLAQDKNREAANSLARIVPPDNDEITYGHYWLVRAELLRRAGKINEALEGAVKSVVFADKDVETFPAALLLSADCYAALEEHHRARDVYYEVAMLFPNTDWGEDALEGLRRIMAGKKAEEKEQTALEDVFFNVTEDINALAEALLNRQKGKE